MEDIRILREETALAYGETGPACTLIEGDNLAALTALRGDFTGKIKCIYIDPPYNTGSRVYPYADGGKGKDRHGGWLGFMSARLEVARELLTEDGVLCISIDDHEMARLRVLCDDLFGEKNFVGSIVVKSNPRGSQSAGKVASLHEYLLIYAKNSAKCAIVGHPLTGKMETEYKYTDEVGAYRLLGLRQRGGFWRASERPNLHYPIWVCPETETLALSPDENHRIEVLPIQPTTGEAGTWRWSRDKVLAEGAALVPRPIKRKGETVWDIYQKDYLAAGGKVRRTKVKSIWEGPAFNYQNAAAEQRALFGDVLFPYAKPLGLLRHILEMIDFKDGDWVLDFFAGSATTGQAVLECSRDDGIRRNILLCTSNENNICRDVAYRRLRRVLETRDCSAQLRYFVVE